MEERTFLDSLREKLGELNIPAPEADRYIRQFERYFNTLSDEEVSEQINGFDSVDIIAHNIVNLIQRKKNRAEEPFPDADLVAEATGTFDPVEESDLDQNTMEYDAAGLDAITTGEVPAVASDSVTEAAARFLEEDEQYTDDFESDFLYDVAPETDPTDAQSASEDPGAVIVEAAFSEEIDTSNTEEASEPTVQMEAVTEEIVTKAPGGEVAVLKTAAENASEIVSDLQDTADIEMTLENTDALDEPVPDKSLSAEEGSATRVNLPAASQQSDEAAGDGTLSPEDFPFSEDLFEEYIPTTRSFVVSAVLSAILWIPLFILAAALYGLAYCMLGALIGAFIVSLVVVTIAGTGLTLVGIIYGVTQMSVSRPIALYEIGLGIALGGVALMAGVLLYNGAVRLMPWVIRRMNRFSRFSVRALRRLVRYFKKACIR